MSAGDRPRREAARDRRRAELREFLRSRRERLTPAAAGLPDTGRRRTPGLRREEVAVPAGGVGSQLGRAARLLGAGRGVGMVGSPAKQEIAEQFGYDEVILRDEIAAAGEFDIVVDMVGGPTCRASLDRLAPLGRMVVMGNASGAADVGLSANELWFTNKTVSGFDLAAFAAAHPAETGAALRRAITAVTAGELTVQVATLALGRVAEAHRRIESGTTTGKLVLEVARSRPGPGRGRAGDQFAMAANMPAS
ncbi:zinc-binding dehydrogenase [Nocardia grenadensis]|uniref:zinc-binding dehydrogenase n=1 Tax=Nocardia grenadensis TaxID=931537 RepID=UPI003D74E5C3